MRVSGIERDNLILAAQTGDPAAIGRLLAVCQTDVRRYAHKHCQASDVDDAVQESLLVISRKVRGLKAAAAFSSWLSRIRKTFRLARLPSHTSACRNSKSRAWLNAPSMIIQLARPRLVTVEIIESFWRVPPTAIVTGVLPRGA